MNALHMCSLAILVLIGVGLAMRRRVRTHVRIMLLAFALDLGLVLWVELSRQAVEKALEFPGGILGVHILISIAVVVLWIVQVGLGVALLRGRFKLRRHHLTVGGLFLIFRIANFVTSLFI